MKSAKMENPFPATTYQGPEYFCDREKETAQLIQNIQSGNSTTLVSIRRIGKTGLLKHVLTQLPEGTRGIYIDILETEHLAQFLNKLATSLLHVDKERSITGRKIWNFIKSIRPVISFDVLTGSPQASFDVKEKDVELNIDAILNFLDTQEFRTVIIIDEFQQITNYPTKNADAWLRSRIQQLKNVVFIFSGSQQHLMTELFNSPKRPFYRSTSMLKLEKLNFAVYRDFIISLFQKYHKEISPAIVEEILEWGDTHTYYIQQICNRVFAATRKQVVAELWKQQAFELLKEQEIVFFGYRNMLTSHQWQLLKAIAQEKKVYQPTGKEFLFRYKLINASSVLRSLQALQKYELVYREFDAKGTPYYSVYDVFLQQWCNRIAF